MTEWHRVRDIAKLVCTVVHGAECALVDNPRKEAVENELAVCNDDIGTSTITPVLLDSEAIRRIYEKCKEYMVNTQQIQSKSKW